jgi:hypothetical protein
MALHLLWALYRLLQFGVLAFIWLKRFWDIGVTWYLITGVICCLNLSKL